MIGGRHQIYRRVEGLGITAVPEGYVVYDHRRDLVHLLNCSAAAVLELCDGEHTLAQIATFIEVAFGLQSVPATDIADCAASLAAQGLIEPGDRS